MRHGIIAAMIAAALMSADIAADTRTTRRNLKASGEKQVTADISRLTPANDSITVNGYDKPLRSTRETLFVTNRSGSAVNMVSVTITYLSVNGEMFHRRSVNLSCHIPPGETRQIAFRAWDMQQAYYHHTTRVTPRSPKAIPYRAEITVDGAIFD